MPLRNHLYRGVIAAFVLALVPAQAALAAAGSPGGGPTVITTTPSAQIGGLPISSLDGQTEYVPGGSGAGSAANLSANRTLTQATVSGSTGFDVSWPQCGGDLPQDSSIAVVGVDDGHPFSQNPCLQQEAAWSPDASTRAQYMVLDSPVGWSSAHVLQYAYSGPAGNCTATDYACQSFNWGYNAAYNDVQYATSQGATSNQWWLDVEVPSTTSINPPGANCYVANFWVCDPKLNALTVVAAVAALKEQGKSVGVYSTQKQWQEITGGIPLGLPIWIAGFDYAPQTYCTPANAQTYWFALGKPSLVQSLPTTFDPDTAC
jgi:hypothetical protein